MNWKINYYIVWLLYIIYFNFNFKVLLPASSILQMATVREACSKFLMRQLHPTNCLGIRSFAGTGKYVKNISSQRNLKYLLSRRVLTLRPFRCLIKIWIIEHVPSFRHTCLQRIAQKVTQVCTSKLSGGYEYRRVLITSISRGMSDLYGLR